MFIRYIRVPLRGQQEGTKMQITDVKTFLVDASSSRWGGRNWLFVKVETDEGIYGLGEASGWPRVVQTAIEDLTPVVVGEDPVRIERIWQRMLLSIMGHGMTGVVGSGALTGIEIALWDILGKKLGVPVCDLLGGRCWDKIRVYGHAGTGEQALALVEQGYTAVKTGAFSLKAGALRGPVRQVKEIREAVGDEIDICVDLHGPPWLTPADAIRIGRAMEPYDLLFFEDPVAPDNVDAIAKVAASVNLPIALGERHATLYGFRELIEREIVDVVQPDMGRAGGLSQGKKIAALAEAHHIMVAPHDGSNGPLAEAAALHLLASIPNGLILEHLVDDVPWRYEVATRMEIRDGYMEVPTKPGLGVELNEEEIMRHPGGGNTHPPDRDIELMYVQARASRAKALGG